MIFAEITFIRPFFALIFFFFHSFVFIKCLPQPDTVLSGLKLQSVLPWGSHIINI